MSLEIKVLEPSQIQEILSYERASISHLEPKDQEFTTWDAVWREEALEHYLPQGWSFGGWENGQLMGYCLTQPLLFFRGMTQSLWVEHLTFDALSVGKELVGTIVGWGRSKHLQKVLFREGDRIENLQDSWKFKKINENSWEISTTKIITQG